MSSKSSSKGVPRSPETIEKIKYTKSLNKKPPWNKGVPKTEQQKLHLSEVRKQRLASGQIKHWNVGNTTPPEVRNKISTTALSQNRTYSEQSKDKRRETIEIKKHHGWIHPSTKRIGVPSVLTEEQRQRIREASALTNARRTVDKKHRIGDYLASHNLCVESSHDGYIFDLCCLVCNTKFSRTVSILSPYRYNIYQGEYCPTCYPVYTGLYSTKYFEDNPDMKDVAAVFYVANLTHAITKEQFLKVGITTRNAHMRLSQEKHIDFTVLTELQMTLHQAFLVEQDVICNMRDLKFLPASNFGGRTECFVNNCLEQLVSHIDESFNRYDIPIRIVATGAEI